MDSTTFGVIGAAYAAAFGAGLLRVRRGTNADALLAALCAIAATAIATIVAQHDPRLRAIETMLERVELTASLAAGPLLLAYFAAALLRRAPRRVEWLHALPAAVSLAVPVPIELVVAHQIAYTIACAFVTFRARTDEAEPFHAAVTRGLLLFFAAVHAAQLVRFGFSDVGLLRNIVPVVASATILLLGLILTLAYRGERLLPQRYRNSSLAAPEATRCIERLDALMRAESPYRDPSLSLGSLAERLAVTTHHLSQSLNQHRGTTLVDYLATFRVEEAKRQLLDPTRDSVTIDAIAEASGFGSRSAFYTAFRRLTGVTPSAFRKSHR
jgi:AraC-like DNA-binding protein